MRNFQTEVQGQQSFYLDSLPLINNKLTKEEILTDYTDGIVNGNILEFKLIITDLNTVLSQAIRYLSAMRIKGKSVPKNIILVSLNTETAYLYDSEDYLDYIESVYVGGASRGITGFSANPYDEKLEYGRKEIDHYRLIELLRSNKFTKINIDENCIVGWAERFYKENPNASKSAFIGDLASGVNIIGEIRQPQYFQDFIKPYTEETNIKFQYLMDKLNDRLTKKDLGAFYTPTLYAEKSYELLYKAIERVPEGNDYIILDRCAGTGNLQLNLPVDILKHCILSTREYYEYKVLIELLGDKVKYIIPPRETLGTFQNGLVRGADALSKEFIENEVIKKYIDDDKITVIIFENPPYSETTGIEHQKVGRSKNSSSWKKSFVIQEMKKNIKGATTNEMSNAFIWSAFQYYLRQPTDSLIVYSPIKYWKSQSLINKKFIDGFAYNRKHFHAPTNALVSCILWSNENSDIKKFNLRAYNIDKENKLIDEGEVSIKRIEYLYSDKYYDTRSFPNDQLGTVPILLNGLEAPDKNKTTFNGVFNDNIIAYMVVHKTGLDNPRLSGCLLIQGRYDGHGFYLRKDNFLEKLPMFSASRFTDHENDWKIMGQLMKSADGYKNYFDDLKKNRLDDFLLKNLLWVSLTHYSHMRTIYGSDGRFYRNELCLDNSNGNTLAINKLKKLKAGKTENELIQQFYKVMKYAKETKEYDCTKTYGLYQIDEELNTFINDKENGKKVFNYPELNGEIKALKSNVKKYYINVIAPKLFEYEFLK